MKNNGFINRVSYNAHYVKWMVNWWKIPVFKIANKKFYVKYFYLWDDSRPVYMWFLVNMFDKKFFDTPEGLKQLLAYELYVTYGLYQKEIAKLLGCSNNTVANHVKKINKYNHLKDFKSVRESKKNQVEQAFKTIKNEI